MRKDFLYLYFCLLEVAQGKNISVRTSTSFSAGRSWSVHDTFVCLNSTISPAPMPGFSNNACILLSSGLKRRSNCIRFVRPLSGVISVMPLPVSSRYCGLASPRKGPRSVHEFAASRSPIKEVNPLSGVRSLMS